VTPGSQDTAASTASGREVAPLDTTLVVVSPENVAFQFRLAGPALRSLALVIDGFAMMAIIILAQFALIPFVVIGADGGLKGLLLVALFFLWWGYGAACEVFNNGQTLGKRMLGLRVVSETGLSINAAQAVLRNLIRVIDIAPPFLPGVVTMALTTRFQRLGDLAAGTVVVLDRVRPRPRPPEQPADAEALAALVPDGWEPPPAFAEALAAYVGRRQALPAGRRRELATIAAARLCAAWGAPLPADPDGLLCVVYDRATAVDGGKA